MPAQVRSRAMGLGMPSPALAEEAELNGKHETPATNAVDGTPGTPTPTPTSLRGLGPSLAMLAKSIHPASTKNDKPRLSLDTFFLAIPPSTMHLLSLAVILTLAQCAILSLANPLPLLGDSSRKLVCANNPKMVAGTPWQRRSLESKAFLPVIAEPGHAKPKNKESDIGYSYHPNPAPRSSDTLIRWCAPRTNVYITLTVTHRVAAEAIRMVLTESYGVVDEVIKHMGDGPVSTTGFNWGAGSAMLQVWDTNNQRTTWGVLAAALAALQDFMLVQGNWVGVTFTVFHGPVEVGKGVIVASNNQQTTNMADLDLAPLPSYANKISVDGGSSEDATSSPSDDSVVGPENGHVQEPDKKPYQVTLRQHPVTELRKPYVPKERDRLIDSGVPRANVAASQESPNGTTEDDYARRHRDQTVLVQHVEYWDQDHDGIIWPQDTYLGVRAWGWSIPLSLFVAYIIHVALSYPTVPGYLPDPSFRIYTARLHKDKHGSDSMTYDHEGRFRPQAFEDIFAKYDKGNKGGLTWRDLIDFWRGQSMVFDLFGISAVVLEWLAVYLLLWPDDGIMRKEDIRRVYDGSIFYKKAEEYKRKQATTRPQSQTSPTLVTKVKKLI
ncbi:MAG: hypothetical protein Q9187_008180 [Circinaria calcarea]